MNIILVVMILSGREWTPIHVIEYPTEAACQAAAKANTSTSSFGPFHTGTKQGVCVPKLTLVK